MGSLSLLQGIFPTQGWNPGLPHCGRILFQLSHKEAFLIPTSQSDPMTWSLYHTVSESHFQSFSYSFSDGSTGAPTSSPFHKRWRLGNMFIKYAIQLTSVKELQYH